MPQSVPRPEPWLDLSEAADFLGVHFTTLRRWADAGQAPSIRTPGGRRRFSRSELAVFLTSLRRGEVSSAPTSSIVAQAAAHPRLMQEPWYSRLDKSQLATMRAQGERLMAVLMQYATRTNGGEVFLEEGRRVATHYGESCARAGLSLMETLQTFIKVRRGIIDPIYEAGTLAGTPDADTWRLYDRINTFLDSMLVAMLETYYCAQQQQLGAPS